jgi:Zn-dependent peptidase ImmA (M78 family)
MKFILDDMLNAVDVPEYSLSSYSTDDMTPSEIARKIRYEMKLYRGPVLSFSTLLENNGIVIMRMDFGTDKIDGLSTVTPSNRKIMFINSLMPNDRVRFSEAHELGHLIMHIAKPSRTSEDAEREADEFASEFLMPKDDVANELRGLTFRKLAQLKRKWGVSMRALVRRARDIGNMTDADYRNMQINFSKRGYAKEEPAPLPSDNPTIVSETLSLYKNELGYTDEDMRHLMRIGKEDYFNWFCPSSRILRLNPLR